MSTETRKPPGKIEDVPNCPICSEPFKPSDICASDITTIVKAKKSEGAQTIPRSKLVKIKRLIQWCVDKTPRTTIQPQFLPII